MPRKPSLPDPQSPAEPTRRLVSAISEVPLAQPAERILTAVVDDISPDGVARVTFSGEDQSRDAASMLRFPSAAEASEALLGSTVMVLAPPSAQPVILGIVGERVWDQREGQPVADARVKLPADEIRALQLDKRRLDLEASEEIRLTCGKSSLVLRRDGMVIVRGVQIVSRATQSNKIRGGTVAIN